MYITIHTKLCLCGMALWAFFFLLEMSVHKNNVSNTYHVLWLTLTKFAKLFWQWIFLSSRQNIVLTPVLCLQKALLSQWVSWPFAVIFWQKVLEKKIVIQSPHSYETDDSHNNKQDFFHDFRFSQTTWKFIMKSRASWEAEIAPPLSPSGLHPVVLIKLFSREQCWLM